MAITSKVFSPEEIDLLGGIGKWRNDPFTRFLRWWLCKGVWNSEPPLYIDRRELEDRVGRLVMAQKMLDGIASTSSSNDGLIIRDIL